MKYLKQLSVYKDIEYLTLLCANCWRLLSIIYMIANSSNENILTWKRIQFEKSSNHPLNSFHIALKNWNATMWKILVGMTRSIQDFVCTTHRVSIEWKYPYKESYTVNSHWKMWKWRHEWRPRMREISKLRIVHVVSKFFH